MSIQRSIGAALETRLLAFLPAMPVALPNVSYTPVIGTPYLKADRLPAGSVRRSIGVDGLNVYTGIYQVMVCFPSGPTPGNWGGAGWCESKADAIANHFPIGAVYASVRIAAVSCAPALSDAAWYSIPVSIAYELVSSL